MGTEYKMSPDYSAAKKEKLDYTSEASRTGFMMRKYFEESTPINDVQSANGLTRLFVMPKCCWAIWNAWLKIIKRSLKEYWTRLSMQ